MSDAPPRDTFVVVPCYNEESRLPDEVLVDFVDRHDFARLVLVDDGSEDRTGEIVDAVRDRRPGAVDSLHLERNSGKAEAVRCGVLSALEAGAGFVGYWDADMSTPLDEVPRFRRVLEGKPALELALGSRVLMLGRDIRRNALRHYVGRCFATCASLALGLAVYDTQCGAKLFRVTDRTAGLFVEPFLSRWLFDVELLARLKKAYRDAGRGPVEEALAEVPLLAWRDVRGSKIEPSYWVKAPLELLRIWRRYR